MTRGIDTKEIAAAACENEIYYPSEMYYKADETVRDKLQEGGCTFDSDNNYIKLHYDKCFSFEKSESKDEQGAFIARKRGEKMSALRM